MLHPPPLLTVVICYAGSLVLSVSQSEEKDMLWMVDPDQFPFMQTLIESQVSCFCLPTLSLGHGRSSWEYYGLLHYTLCLLCHLKQLIAWESCVFFSPWTICVLFYVKNHHTLRILDSVFTTTVISFLYMCLGEHSAKWPHLGYCWVDWARWAGGPLLSHCSTTICGQPACSVAKKIHFADNSRQLRVDQAETCWSAAVASWPM